jgi:RNA-splicing ligase RtcB
MEVILNGLGITQTECAERFSTIHNYIDTDAMILRKGAVSARAGEKLIIPINMRDGSIICEGLGNPDWNYSSPHGAGRTMSRKKAFATLQMEEYEKSMKGIYSTSVTKDTLDESPMAYKTMSDIIDNISPTAKIIKIIKPVYNFKASEDKRNGKH